MAESDGLPGCWDPEWRRRWRDKLVDPDAAVGRVRPGSRIFIGSGCAEPRFLVDRLAARRDRLRDTELLHLLTMSVSPHTDARYADSFRLNAFFIGDNVREAVWDGRADYTPVFLSELPGLFRSGASRLDAALIQVTPPDEHGYVSLGISVDVSKAAAESAELVIAQVNPRMPRTLGDTFLPLSAIDALVDKEEPLLEFPRMDQDEVSRAIGHHLATLVPDGATLQIGIGQIPDAVLGELDGHNDLGIHTEMFSDGVVRLIRRGVINCRAKTLHKGKVVASFCMGSHDLYRFVHDNPLFEFHPSEYTNDPQVIAQNRSLVAINSALEIDLTGQVCSDSIGHRFYSGIGGQVDFMRGAARSPGGRPVIALPSTYTGSDGVRRSRIVGTLAPGAGVVTTRGNIHWVVTEYGAAYLHGRNIRERALSLIEIAHPDFRDQLLEEAKRQKFVYPDQRPLAKVEVPERYRRWEEFQGGALRVLFRPVRVNDEQVVQRLFHGMSDRSRCYRFFRAMQALPHREAQKFSTVDYQNDMGLLAVLPAEPEVGEERAVGSAQYMVDPKTNSAEVAFMVLEEYQGKGVGTALLRHLAAIARENGLRTFTAEVLSANKAMMRVFLKSGYAVHFSLDEDSFSIHMDLMNRPAKTPGDPTPVPPAATGTPAT